MLSHYLAFGLGTVFVFSPVAAIRLLALGPVIPVVESFPELQSRLDQAWTNNVQSILVPPGFPYTEDVGMVAFASNFPLETLFPTPPEPEDGVVTYTLTLSESTNAPVVRTWFSPVGVVTNTVPPGDYTPEGWVLATHPQPSYLTPARVNTWVAGWSLSGRQTLRCRLIATNDVPAYLASLTIRAAQSPTPVATNEIGAVSVRLSADGVAADILVQAPPEVDFVGVYQKPTLTPFAAWSLLGQLAHVSAPIAYRHILTGDHQVLMFANHVQDSDGDGIPDAWETLVFGTDPDYEDSDDDGLSDFEEAITYLSNPMARDSDGDGVMDSTEIRAGYDPNDFQSLTRFDLARLLGLPPMELLIVS